MMWDQDSLGYAFWVGVFSGALVTVLIGLFVMGLVFP